MSAEQKNSITELGRQKKLLREEYEYEKEEFRRQTETIGIERKVKRGDCWYPVSVGRSYYNSLNQYVTEFTRSADEEIEHNFEFGRPVSFFRIDSEGKIRYFDFTGTISYVENNRMVVVVPESGIVTEMRNTDSLGVQLHFDETSYRLMFEALDRVMAAKDDRLSYLRDLFYGEAPAKTRATAPLQFHWLNPTQQEAVNKVLCAKDVAIVHGPPGTGKTTTLVEAIYETLMRESQVLVCAQSNMAVDWISEKLVDRGISVLRIGNPTRVNDKMLSFTYERRFEAHPDYPQLWAIRRSIRQLKGSKGRGTEAVQRKIDKLRDRATEIEFKINGELFGEARVVACTLTGSANRVLEGMKFDTLFIDEAAQAMEAACWIAISKASRVILAGDHCQLPPTVKNIEALKGGLGKTLMERIVENKPETVTLLGTQYRMNDVIMKFSSDWFYDGKVEAGPDNKFRTIIPFETTMEWVDTTGFGYKERFVGESYGRINKEEAKLALRRLEGYFGTIGAERILNEEISVGIISPYRAQVQYLRRLVKGSASFKPFRGLISINTVDGFQGQERDIILISLVRSNDDGQIGFLQDLRRMNVAITRARMKLFIVGDASTMTRHPFYRKLHDYIKGLEEDARRAEND